MPKVTINTRRFPTNQILIPSGSAQLTDNTPLTQSAPPSFDLPDAMNPGQFFHYVFLFWNALGAVHPNPLLQIPDVGTTDFFATQWYVLTGGNGVPVPHVETYALSTGSDQILADTPIQSVNPPAAQTAPAVVSTTGGPVDITAKSAFGLEPFGAWTVFGNGTPNGLHLTASLNAFATGIAAYAQAKGFVPPIIELIDILAVIKGKIRDIGDPPPFDLLRLANRIAEGGSPMGPLAADELSSLLSRVASMGTKELQEAVADLKAQQTRLDAAVKMLEAAIKQAAGK